MKIQHHTTAERIAAAVVIITGLCLALSLLTSCRSVPIVPPASTDSVRVRVEVRVDSVWRDRVHKEYIKGDTLEIHDSIYFEVTRWRDRTDTLRVRDSIPYPVEIPKPYPVRSAYDKATARGFWVLLVLVLLSITARVLWRVYIKK